MKIIYRSFAEINVDFLKDNLQKIYKLSNKKIWAVVKADAYGHGSVIVSKNIENLDFIEGFCVATPIEGKELREEGINKKILVLGGLFKEEVDIYNLYNLTPVVYDFTQIENAKFLKNNNIHIKFDTGMGRLGFCKGDIENIKKHLDYFNVEGVLSHFPSADTNKELTNNQILMLKYILDNLNINPKYIHTQNSTGLVYKCDFCNTVRVGIAMYGEKPSEDFPIDLKQIMTVKAKIISVKNIKKGSSISYNGTFIADRDMKIAVVAFGYADGMPRLLSNKGYVLYKGKKAKIVGNVTMDMTIIDVTDFEDVKVGDYVTVFGYDNNEKISFKEVADMVGTIPYEIMCGISKRVLRFEVKNA